MKRALGDQAHPAATYEKRTCDRGPGVIERADKALQCTHIQRSVGIEEQNQP
jgi:hypothetical protein